MHRRLPSPLHDHRLRGPRRLAGRRELRRRRAAGQQRGSAQLRKGAVKPSKLAPRTLRMLRARAGGTGPAGAQGVAGPKGEQGATGDTGPAGPFPAVLPSGRTIRGEYAMYEVATGAGSPARDAVSFVFPLPASPKVQAEVLLQADPPDAACPGSYLAPEAAPGHLCVYERVPVSSAGLKVISMDRNGAVLGTLSAAGGNFGSLGTWAVTAP